MKAQLFLKSLIFSLLISCGNSADFSESTKTDTDIEPDRNTENIFEINTQKNKILQFSSKTIKTHSFQAFHDRNFNNIQITLEDIYSERQEHFTQTERPFITESFQQGFEGSPVEEEFSQIKNRGIVDILLVIDDSRSMAEEQKNLSTKLGSLLTYIQDTSWKIAITTTTEDPFNKCDIDIISHQTPNPIKRFAELTQVGISGSGKEMGILKAKQALSCDKKPWVRKNSTLAVVFVSDEDNCSKDGEDCKSKPWGSENYLLNYIEHDLGRTVAVDTRFYGIFSPPDQPCQKATNTATQYMRLLSYKGDDIKRYGNICDRDYSETLERISLDISSLLVRSWNLKFPPDVSGVVKVWIGKDKDKILIPQTHYEIKDQRLLFKPDHAPKAGSRISIAYETGSKPKFSQLKMQKQADENSLIVNIDNVKVKKDQYRLENNIIYFDNAPGDGSLVRLDYRENKKLEKRFKLQQMPESDSFKILINGKPIPNSYYQIDGESIEFDLPPKDGEKISVHYKTKVGPKLAYQVPISGSDAREYVLKNSNNDVLDFTLENDTILIDPQDHQNGKQLMLSYISNDSSIKTYLLEHDFVLIESISISSDNPSCLFPEDFEVTKAVIKNFCEISKLSQFDISYQFADFTNRFYLGRLSQTSKELIRVYLDGKATNNYILTEDHLVIEQYEDTVKEYTVQIFIPI